MTALNQEGVSSLRTFTIVRRELDSSGNGQLFGLLSGTEPPPVHLNCLIGLQGTWLWFNEFGSSDKDDLLTVPVDSTDALKQDDILYLLPPPFQPPLSFILLDKSKVGVEKTFAVGLAARARILGTDGNYLIRTRSIENEDQLEPGETVEPAGWDHEHCELCYKHVTSDDTYFFFAWGEGGSYLCEFCNSRFAKPHCIRDVIYPGHGERVDEQD